jgi:hypothetical protein
MPCSLQLFHSLPAAPQSPRHERTRISYPIIHLVETIQFSYLRLSFVDIYLLCERTMPDFFDHLFACSLVSNGTIFSTSSLRYLPLHSNRRMITRNELLVWANRLILDALFFSSEALNDCMSAVILGYNSIDASNSIPLDVVEDARHCW